MMAKLWIMGRKVKLPEIKILKKSLTRSEKMKNVIGIEEPTPQLIRIPKDRISISFRDAYFI